MKLHNKKEVRMSEFQEMESVEIGDLSQVEEQKMVIPATKGVKLLIKKAENSVNEANTYRQISLQLQIVDGIDEEGKYKNKVLFSRVCYYADPNAYTKDFFKSRQHLVQLKNLMKAVESESQVIDAEFLSGLEGLLIKGDITTKKDKEGNLDNEVRNFKTLDISEIV